MTVEELRGTVRKQIASCGGKGFVRFAAEGDALLVTDAPGRMNSLQRETLRKQLKNDGWSIQKQGNLWLLVPGFVLLDSLWQDWNGLPESIPEQFYGIYSLGIRWAKKERLERGKEALRLMNDTARILWRKPEEMDMLLWTLRAEGAVLQREHKESGMYEAGRMLLAWCKDRIMESEMQ